ncbi:MAG: hypothetical protein U9N45_07885, partial [Gemmatimonadota bacterium]|nr:hypothetical protein [Gemmatimonadota bacterium]
MIALSALTVLPEVRLRSLERTLRSGTVAAGNFFRLTRVPAPVLVALSLVEEPEVRPAWAAETARLRVNVSRTPSVEATADSPALTSMPPVE